MKETCVICGGKFEKRHVKNVTCSKMCDDMKANAAMNEKWMTKKKQKNMASPVRWGTKGVLQ